eukprot:CAMPEP_0174316006 /NCGR_PEP_ID=MMETSP0810-20121108/6647_1 /TAXON_ID=73025 ORGANISM="Eutreptiella gymnastica-like, Strain CCMP1594" /NCGR_SAMPLE_ID=MMETSP0810 /ASSEMBLY_ACC=CAM_ASM_000659 /LENGTH=207 /DNA_ID=CAMNT_0015425545 /DNA_START=695 /DNA_END=1318 /DNA_ORIENTATION=+
MPGLGSRGIAQQLNATGQFPPGAQHPKAPRILRAFQCIPTFGLEHGAEPPPTTVFDLSLAPQHKKPQEGTRAAIYTEMARAEYLKGQNPLCLHDHATHDHSLNTPMTENSVTPHNNDASSISRQQKAAGVRSAAPFASPETSEKRAHLAHVEKPGFEVEYGQLLLKHSYPSAPQYSEEFGAESHPQSWFSLREQGRQQASTPAAQQA